MTQTFPTPNPLSLPQAIVQRVQQLPLTVDLQQWLENALAQCAASSPVPDQCLQSTTAYLAAARSPQALVSLFERDPQSFHRLTRMLSCSPGLAGMLIRDPESFDLLRITEGQAVDRRVLMDEIAAECALAGSQQAVESILSRHRRRETLRIVYGNLLTGQPIQRTCEQFSYLADAILSAALTASRRIVLQRRTNRALPEEQSVDMAVVAFGAYGGLELDLCDELDILLVYDTWSNSQFPATQRDQEQLEDFVNAWAEVFQAIVSVEDVLGPAYRLQHRLRPEEQRGSAVKLTNFVRFLERSGRTWHRQSLIKMRLAAGSTMIGQSLHSQLTGWVYRRYLGAADWSGLQAQRRKLARPASVDPQGSSALDLVTNICGDIEGVTQFLQLLNGAELDSLRAGNTWHALAALEQSGCLTLQEQTLLTDHYSTLRQYGLRLQLARLPVQLNVKPNRAPNPNAVQEEEGADAETPLLACGMPETSTLLSECWQRRQVCRRIIEHLVHDVFADASEIPIETEMVLDPQVALEKVNQVLKSYGFHSPQSAWEQLKGLAQEPIPFLSDRRTRHFLAGIAPRLLEEIAGTPHPDTTLQQLGAVGDSLGGKGALWELFQTAPSTLRLCIRLCASSPYLVGVLINNPGMLDELLDSLILDRLPQTQELEIASRELCRSAEDIDPILHSFKNSAHLRIGVRDILGRDCIQATHRAIADTADCCLTRIAEHEYEFLCDRYGEPLDATGQQCGLTLMAMGKLGGREPNYHSDLDVLFLYDAEGQTRPRAGGRRTGTSNHHFFNELSQRIAKRVNHYGPSGRLYELDSQLRLTQYRGTIAVSLEQLRQHFDSPHIELWQKLQLLSARIVFSNSLAPKGIMEIVGRVLRGQEWSPEIASRIRQLRLALQQGAGAENIKRGPGGTLDIEFLVRMLLLKHVAGFQGRAGWGTLSGLDYLKDCGGIDVESGQQLAASYRYLRSVESNLRLMNLPARHDLPQSSEELRWLAYMLRETHWDIVVQKCAAYRELNRQLFERILSSETA